MLRPPRHPGPWTAWTSPARSLPTAPTATSIPSISLSIPLLLAIPASTMSCPQKPGAAHGILVDPRDFAWSESGGIVLKQLDDEIRIELAMFGVTIGRLFDFADDLLPQRFG